MSANPSIVTGARAASGVADASDPLCNLRVHMVGVGGSGMSGLAALLLRRGAQVSGSDACASIVVARLADSGARVTTGDVPAPIPPDTQLVVASAAVPSDHPELHAARQRGIPILKYAQMLGRVMQHCHGIAIAGTHGKSTTTAWTTYVLRCAGVDPSFVVGAVSSQLGGGSGAGSGPHFVAEACEYDRSFLNLSPRAAAILNIEEDHLDCYADLSAIQQAFTEFAARLPADGLLVINGDDPACAPVAATAPATVERFGLGEHCEWRAIDVRERDGRYSFELLRRGRPQGRLELGLAGRHNVLNALAVAALAHHAGAAPEALATGLRDFHGVGRRLELRGTVNGVHVVDDYAHHPTEIRATLAAARERYRPQRLWCIFQPHQHSRTRFLLEDFAASFAQADRIVVPDIYFVRDSAREREAVCAEDLVARIVARGGAAAHMGDFAEIVDRLADEAAPGDLVMTMGAGTIWKVADDLVRRLGGHLPA